MKRVLSLILALVTLIGALPVNVLATETCTEPHNHAEHEIVEETAPSETLPAETETEHTHEHTSDGAALPDQSVYEGKTIACDRFLEQLCDQPEELGSVQDQYPWIYSA